LTLQFGSNERPGLLDEDPELAPFVPACEDFNWMLKLLSNMERAMRLELATPGTITTNA